MDARSCLLSVPNHFNPFSDIDLESQNAALIPHHVRSANNMASLLGKANGAAPSFAIGSQPSYGWNGNEIRHSPHVFGLDLLHQPRVDNLAATFVDSFKSQMLPPVLETDASNDRYHGHEYQSDLKVAFDQSQRQMFHQPVYYPDPRHDLPASSADHSQGSIVQAAPEPNVYCEINVHAMQHKMSNGVAQHTDAHVNSTFSNDVSMTHLDQSPPPVVKKPRRQPRHFTFSARHIALSQSRPARVLNLKR